MLGANLEPLLEALRERLAAEEPPKSLGGKKEAGESRPLCRRLKTRCHPTTLPERLGELYDAEAAKAAEKAAAAATAEGGAEVGAQIGADDELEEDLENGQNNGNSGDDDEEGEGDDEEEELVSFGGGGFGAKPKGKKKKGGKKAWNWKKELTDWLHKLTGD